MSEDRELSLEEQKRLLAVARQTIAEHTQGKAVTKQQPDLPGLAFKRGAFVTLHRQGALRGCIGNFMSEGPLMEMVQDMAVAASSHDPRFPPVAASELDGLDLEISVLSPLRKIESIEDIQVGVHGIYIISPRARGVLLPQVATEYGWDRETFLDQTCVKAGLRPGCWRGPEVEILIFSAQVFSEKDLEEAG